MPIYPADTLLLPPIAGSGQGSGEIVQPFIATVNTMLGYNNPSGTAAAGFLASDLILLSVIPPGAVLTGYRVLLPATDTSTGSTWGLGDTSVASGAVTGQLSTTAQTTPANIGTSFTLTASASTASFASSGYLVVGNGLLVQYGGLSGSTFTTCYASSPNFMIPAGAPIQQIANTLFYNAAVAIGQSSHAGLFAPDYWIANTTLTALLPKFQLPQAYPYGYNTMNPAVGAYPPTFGNVNPIYFVLECGANATTNPSYASTAQFVGHIQYMLRGNYPSNQNVG